MARDTTSPDTHSARPAHRPSRRDDIVDAAIGVFAEAGYASANVDDIAAAAGLTPAAFYYHFGTKDELFHEVMRTVYDRFSAAVRAPRTGMEQDIELSVLGEVIEAGWAHWRAHPDDARLVGQYASGPTPRARALREEFEQRHVDGAYDYAQPEAVRRRQNHDGNASRTLRMRNVVELVLASQAASVPGGPLAAHDLDEVVDAVRDTCVSLVIGFPIA